MRCELLIPRMVAIHARNAVYTALSGVAGVERAEVELGRAVVTHDGSVREDVLRAAIGDVGFVVGEIRVLPRELPLA
jgi:copper chaperone CopZ